MDPSTLNYVFTYGFVVVLVVGYLLWRPKKQVSRLKLRETAGQNKLDLTEFKNAPEHTRREERDLNIIFQFNGHDFDVYEVFGLPAGSGFEAVERAYREAIETSDRDSHPFYEMAFRAASLRRKT